MVLNALAGDKHIVHQMGDAPHAKATVGDVLVLEILTGTADSVLPDFITDSDFPSPWLLATFATHVARGLKSLHGAGLVHGDMKLQNVMWCAERLVFVLIDFGLSSRVDERYNFMVHSRGCSAAEVMSWNALVAAHPLPAQLKYEAVARPGQPADIWALGCTLAKAAFGRPLFPNGGPEEQSAVDRILDNRIREITSRYSREFCQDLLQFLKRCLRVVPEERATAEELCGSWQGAGTPSHQDMMTLPSPVLRVDNVCDRWEKEPVQL
ncbi:serine/threonine-protein kinase Kist-like [Hyalella azteca]|uniref:Serine/threonine-protein kinase Kist-like n=1 Tax=Hyalella azteca TaxID=294128 RepID=A0A8B7N6I9_HYAAZ|nr:serine/threonine-protein kinase Kist-like [Hyalella azteca]